ncbi:hypothetical protein D3C73_1427090 [compost metagenome]
MIVYISRYQHIRTTEHGLFPIAASGASDNGSLFNLTIQISYYPNRRYFKLLFYPLYKSIQTDRLGKLTHPA